MVRERMNGRTSESDRLEWAPPPLIGTNCIRDNSKQLTAPLTEVEWSIRMTWFPWEHPTLTADPRRPAHRPRSQALFCEPEHPLRAMKVIVNAELLLHTTQGPKVDFLLQLLATPPVEGMLFSPDGPPATALTAMNGFTGETSFIDWISLDEDNSQGRIQVHHWQD